MSQHKPITIVGGGLAGLTLGIGLRQREVPVTVWEAGHYPRHKVCGEFISGQGQEVLRRLDLMSLLEQVGVIYAGTARFFFGGASTPCRRIEPGALCLSRFVMDDLLAKRFRELGGELRQNTRWKEEEPCQGMVRASGRRAQPTVNGWRWFGLKAHARQVQLEADLEMHSTENGYVGLCILPEGEINVCGLFRTRTGSSGSAVYDLLKGSPGTALNKRMAAAVFDRDSFCSVAGLTMEPHRAQGQNGWQIGDALTMIPPVTGNGMSMAFESAELTLRPLLDYTSGKMDWQTAHKTAATACDAAFKARLFWAKRLQSLMFSPLLRRPLGRVILNSTWVWRLLFERTR
jgi:menaquinone-9 beta-reductase